MTATATGELPHELSIAQFAEVTAHAERTIRRHLIKGTIQFRWGLTSNNQVCKWIPRSEVHKFLTRAQRQRNAP